jgi:hypothetical protein
MSESSADMSQEGLRSSASESPRLLVANPLNGIILWPQPWLRVASNCTLAGQPNNLAAAAGAK